MSIFDRRQPHVAPPPRRYACEHCDFTSPDPDVTLGHMFQSHVNRRLGATGPNRGRRKGDAASPWVQANLAAAAKGEGLSRPPRLS